MVKNKLESMFSESLRLSGLWGMKLQSNQLAHTQNPADFILTLDSGEHHFTILVECKQESGDRLAFKRLRQMNDLLTFDAMNFHHRAYFLITYWAGKWIDSEVYLVTATKMQEIIQSHNMLSLNREDARRIMAEYLVPIQKGSIIDIKSILLSKV